MKVLEIGFLQSHKISIVSQLFSSKFTLNMDFSHYFYLSTYYSGSFPVLSSTAFSPWSTASALLLSVHISHSFTALFPKDEKPTCFPELLPSTFCRFSWLCIFPFTSFSPRSHLLSFFWALVSYNFLTSPNQHMIPSPQQSQWHFKDGLPSPMGIGFILLNSVRNSFNDLKINHSPFALVCLSRAFLKENSCNRTISGGMSSYSSGQ